MLRFHLARLLRNLARYLNLMIGATKVIDFVALIREQP